MTGSQMEQDALIAVSRNMKNLGEIADYLKGIEKQMKVANELKALELKSKYPEITMLVDNLI